MLEKFTPEEIAQIKRELRFLGTENSITKSIVLFPFRQEIKAIFPEFVHKRQEDYYTGEQRRIMGSLTTLCDYTLHNYIATPDDGDEKIEINRNIETDLQNIYKQMMFDLLDIAKKYKEENEDV